MKLFEDVVANLTEAVFSNRVELAAVDAFRAYDADVALAADTAADADVAYDELIAALAEVAVPDIDPLNDPVNPVVDVTEPLNIAGPIFVNVPLPVTVNEPVIVIVDALTLKLAELVIAFVVVKYAN